MRSRNDQQRTRGDMEQPLRDATRQHPCHRSMATGAGDYQVGSNVTGTIGDRICRSALSSSRHLERHRNPALLEFGGLPPQRVLGPTFIGPRVVRAKSAMSHLIDMNDYQLCSVLFRQPTRDAQSVLGGLRSICSPDNYVEHSHTILNLCPGPRGCRSVASRTPGGSRRSSPMRFGSTLLPTAPSCHIHSRTT